MESFRNVNFSKDLPSLLAFCRCRAHLRVFNSFLNSRSSCMSSWTSYIDILSPQLDLAICCKENAFLHVAITSRFSLNTLCMVPPVPVSKNQYKIISFFPFKIFAFNNFSSLLLGFFRLHFAFQLLPLPSPRY